MHRICILIGFVLLSREDKYFESNLNLHIIPHGIIYFEAPVVVRGTEFGSDAVM